MQNIYASCVALDSKGILFLGKSGCGKSDMCLRLIMEKQAILVADDRVNIMVEDGQLQACNVENLAGLLEVRGIGVVSFPFAEKMPIKLVVKLVENPKDVERLPTANYFEYLDLKIPEISLYAFEPSAVDKVVLALTRL